MPTGKQVKAGRAFLGWSADDLASRAGLSRECILQAERGEKRPRADTLEKIIRVFGDAGLEFDGDRGVTLLPDNCRIIEGRDCYLRLLNEVLQNLRGKKGAEVLSICTDDSVSPPEVVEAITGWHNAGIKCRFLSHNKATRFDFPLEEYRLIAREHFKNSVMVVYGNKVATLRGDGTAVTVFNDKDNAEMLRGLFEVIWLQSAAPNAKKVRK